MFLKALEGAFFLGELGWRAPLVSYGAHLRQNAGALHALFETAQDARVVFVFVPGNFKIGYHTSHENSIRSVSNQALLAACCKYAGRL